MSFKKLSWMCSECACVFDATPHNLVFSSCRCCVHQKAETSKRPQYDGTIPLEITRPIRAGLLQSIGNDVLIGIVMYLIDCEGAHALASTHIAEVSQYTREQLLDGGFWWDDTSQRKNGSRYRHMPYAKRKTNTPLPHSTSPCATPCEPNVFVDKIPTIQLSHGDVDELSTCVGESVLYIEYHMWDDVRQAIDEDLRAFWGLWETVIAPCVVCW